MNKPRMHLRAVGLGMINGLIFGFIFEIANRIFFWFQLRELQRMAIEGGSPVYVYPWKWWTLPSVFLLIFAIMSLIMHWLRANQSISIKRLWHEIGFGSVLAFILYVLISYGLSDLLSGSNVIGKGLFVGGFAKVLFLFGLAFVLNSIFGRLLQRMSNNQGRRKENLVPKNAG